MQKIVIDTNVVVSALIGSSYPRKIIYELVLDKKVIVCLSSEVLAEYITVLNRSKFAKYPGFVTNAEIVLNKIDELSLKYLPTIKVAVIKDKTDNKFLELGIKANADFLITGNVNDFTLKEFASFKIVTPEEYINNYYRQ